MADLISQFDLNDNGSSAPVAHASQSSYTCPDRPTCPPPVLFHVPYSPFAVDFDEFCELMTREAGGAPIEAVREAARQVHPLSTRSRALSMLLHPLSVPPPLPYKRWSSRLYRRYRRCRRPSSSRRRREASRGGGGVARAKEARRCILHERAGPEVRGAPCTVNYKLAGTSARSVPWGVWPQSFRGCWYT